MLVNAEKLVELAAQKADGAAGRAGATPARFNIQTVDQVLQQAAPMWRVVGVLPAKGLVVIYGQPGSGKTFVVLDMFAAIVRGIPWAGRRTKRGRIVYIAAEGSLKLRLQAYLSANELDADDLDGFLVLDSSLDLLDAAATVDPLLVALDELRKDGEIAAVVIDTLNRAMPGGDENSPEDMGAMVAAAKRIEDRLGCTVVYIHHSGKDEARGSRGHSSLKGATDAELSVKRDKDDLRSVTAEKIRDGADGDVLLTFRLRSVDLGPMTEIDPEAGPEERVTSCVVAPGEAVEINLSLPRREPTGKNQKIVLDALRGMRERFEPLPETSAIPAGVSGVEIETLMIHAAPKMAQPDEWRRKDRARQALESLRDAGWVGIHQPWTWLT